MIFELGIIHKGIPLINKQYYEEYNTKITANLRGGFLSGLNSFVEEAFSDEIESFTMKNFKLIMLNRIIEEIKNQKITIYCIGDKKLSLKFAKKALNEVLDEFIKKFIKNLIKFDGNLSPFYKFNEILDRILGDLTKKPDDRFRTIFE